MPASHSTAVRKARNAENAPLRSGDSDQRSPGRPTGDGTPTSNADVELVSLTLRDIPIELRERLARLAAREQVLVRDLGRYILEQGLADIEKNGLPAKRGISPATRYRLYGD